MKLGYSETEPTNETPGSRCAQFGHLTIGHSRKCIKCGEQIPPDAEIVMSA